MCVGEVLRCRWPPPQCLFTCDVTSGYERFKGSMNKSPYLFNSRDQDVTSAPNVGLTTNRCRTGRYSTRQKVECLIPDEINVMFIEFILRAALWP
jgi:hypothetical protein